MDIDFIGFVGDCLVSGRLDLHADRLTDQLNAETDITLRDVVLEGLDGGRVEVDSFSVARTELCAVVGSGPRGARVLRVPTDARRLQAQIGPYMVLGRYHGPVGATTLRTFTERDPMVPLTDVTIAYVVDGVLDVRDVDVLIVNRELAAWFHDPDEADGSDERHGSFEPPWTAAQRDRSTQHHARHRDPDRQPVPNARRR